MARGGKLSNLKPSLSTLAPRLGYAPGDEKARDRQRRDTQPWRTWYKTARWERLRKQVLVRDLYTCQRTGELWMHGGEKPPVTRCAGRHRAPLSCV